MNEAEAEHQRTKAMFIAALKQPEDQRIPFLKNACADDPKMQQKIEELLTDHARMPDTLEQPIAAYPRPLPDKIGPFKIRQEIGHGGMGVVYLAEREKPRQLVALKIIKMGMDNHAMLARFEAEQEAVALMDHPCVAKMYQVGTTEDGQPYFVMEYVAGLPITTYCDEQCLNTKQRLKLFIDVCNAVQHAHQKGIIHRDIKPSNILVTEKDDQPIPKVIDFGVAKSTARALTDQAQFTQFGQLVGTPDYMSPEQAGEDPRDIDTRTDIFSLGVLLYELLAGVLPFERHMLQTAALSEIQRIIREVDPPRPSSRLSRLGETSTNVARMRGTEVRKLTSVLQGDLDWIVMKCLEKDRKLRYHTANDLSVEIDRYFNNEPVLAGPPGAGYLIRKFFRRHRTFVGVTAVSCMLLAASFVSISMSYVSARKAERHAAKESRRARIALTESAAYTEVLKHVLGMQHLQRSKAYRSYPPQPNIDAAQQTIKSFRQFLETLPVKKPDASTSLSAARSVCGTQSNVKDSNMRWQSTTVSGNATMDSARFNVEAPVLIAMVDGMATISGKVMASSAYCNVQGDFSETPFYDDNQQTDGIFVTSSGRFGRSRIHSFDSILDKAVTMHISSVLIPNEDTCGYAVTSNFDYLASKNIDIRMFAKELADAGIEITKIHISDGGVIKVSLLDHFFSVHVAPSDSQNQSKNSRGD